MNQKYNSILEQFFHTEKITEYSLEKIRYACEYFGNPEKSFRSIHIAGTNGKGSVSKMIFQMLKESGKRVGVYTSPHLMDIRERFEVGNCSTLEQDKHFSLKGNILPGVGKKKSEGLISEDDFARIAEMILAYGHGLSYFEKCVILAFLYFREQACEYGVIEVGMGGRLDATNIITPILSIITSISYDHMEFLGDTLEEIATEKGGIIKPGIPVILYAENPTLEHIAQENNTRIILPKKRTLHTHLAGEHQQSNAHIAYEAGLFLGIDEDTIRSALMHVEHHGRLEYITSNLLIDGAHNEAGFRALRVYLDSVSSGWQEIIYCFNLKKGKSARMVLDIFTDIAHHWIGVDTMNDMVEDPEILGNEIDTNEICYQICTPTDLYRLSRDHPEKLFVVFGSLYMIGEVLQFATYDKNPNSRQSMATL